MPFYDYSCSACAATWETMASISAPAETTCPKCGQHTAKRLVGGGGGFKLVGDGWAKDNYSKPGVRR